MGRGPRIRVVTPADLPTLAETVEGGSPMRDVLSDPRGAWARASMDAWGLCGVACVEEELPVAHALVCPGLQLPAEHPLARWSRSPGSAHLLALHLPDAVEDVDAQAGHARLLVQGLARHLASGADTLEAVGRHSRPTRLEPSADCLGRAGFVPLDEVQRDGALRMRLDLGSALRWRPGELHRTWQRLGELLPRPIPPAEPTRRQEQG